MAASKKTAVVKAAPPAPPAPQSVHPGQLITALMQKPDLDTEKVMQLFEIQERFDAKMAREAYYDAITKFRGLVADIDYNKTANFGGKGASYGYATLRHMLKVITPALEECGLTPTWQPGMTETGDVLMVCYINHRLGHSESCTMSAGADTSGSKNSIQAVKSTQSYLRRMTLEAMLGVAADEADDDDGTAAGIDLVGPDEVEILEKLIAETKTDLARFLVAFGVASLDKLPLDKMANATDLLNQKKKAGAK